MSLFNATPSRFKLNHTIDNTLHALFSFAPPKMDEKERAPLNLSLVIDRSGSMAGAKLDYVRKSCVKLIELLKDTDSISIVAFDTEVNLVADVTECTAVNKAALIAKVNGIHSGSSTNLSGGLFQGLALTTVKAAMAKGPVVSRVLLFTDGQQNAGVVDPVKLATMALELRGSVGIATFGYGSDYNASLLQALAQNGGHYYIDSPDKILTAFGTELGALTTTFAQNVEVRLKPGDDVVIEEVLNDLTVSGPDADGHFVVKCDDLMAEQPYQVVVKLTAKKRDNIFPRETTLLTAAAKFMNLALTKQDEAFAALKVQFVNAGEEDAKDDSVVMNEVGVQLVVKAQVASLQRASAGDYDGAVKCMVDVGVAVQDFAPEAFKMANASKGMVETRTSFMRGGEVQMRATNNVLRSRRGAMKGMMLGGVDLHNAYASVGESGTAALFEEPKPSVGVGVGVVPMVGAATSLYLDPASAGAAAVGVAPVVLTPPAPASPVKTRSKRW